MSSQSSQLDALLPLISSSVEVVKSEYAKQGHAVPSPDSVTLHPMDSVLPGLGLKRAVQTLEGACAQLTTIVAPPAHIYQRAFDSSLISRFYVTLTLGL